MKISEKVKFLMLIYKTGSVIFRRFGGMGLGFGDLALMQAIAEAPEGKIRRTDLADAVGLTASGVTRQLLPLEKIGVIKREEHERDGRASYVSLTKSGHQMLKETLDWLEMKAGEVLPDHEIRKIHHASELLENIIR